MQTFGCLATRYASFRREYQRIPELPPNSGTRAPEAISPLV